MTDKLTKQAEALKNRETFEQEWARAVDPFERKPFVPEQYPGYEKCWPELARK